MKLQFDRFFFFQFSASALFKGTFAFLI